MKFEYNTLFKIATILCLQMGCLLLMGEKSHAQNDCGDATPIIETTIECNEEVAEFVVILSVTGGVPPYTLTGDVFVGSLEEGESVVIGPVSDGGSVTAIITDQVDCKAEYQSEPIACSKCQASAGIMSKVLQYVCDEDDLQLITSNATIGDNNALV